MALSGLREIKAHRVPVASKVFAYGWYQCVCSSHAELFYKDTKTKKTHFSHGKFSSDIPPRISHMGLWPRGLDFRLRERLLLYVLKAGDRHLITHLSSDSGTSGHVQKSRELFPRKRKMSGGEYLDFSPVAL